jgi:hypothetical protein
MEKNATYTCIMKYFVLTSIILLLLFAGNRHSYIPKSIFAIEANGTNANSNVDNLTSNKSVVNGSSVAPDVSVNTENNKMSPDTFGTTSPDEQNTDYINNIVKELSSASSSKIANYPINDISSDDIVRVLNKLSVTDLYKVLSGINQNSFMNLLNEQLSPDQVNQILDRLPADKKQSIENRVTS